MPAGTITLVLSGNHSCHGAARAPAHSSVLASNRLLIVCWLCLSTASSSLTAADSNAGSDDNRPHENLYEKYKTRVVTNAPAVTGATNIHSQHDWEFSWEGWNGLKLGVSQSTPLKNPRELLGLQPLTSNVPVLNLQQLKFETRLKALLEVDGTAYATSGNMDDPNDIQLRRARVKAQGDCILLLPLSYEIELGYIPHKFNLNQAWFSSQNYDYIGYFQAGVFGPPMGLDLITSTRDLTFMEPASCLQALAPGNEAGIQVGHPVLNQRGTWALGIFGGGLVASEYGNDSGNYGNLMGRLSYLALDHIAPQPAQNRLLHLGLSANVQYSANSQVQYRSRPESYLARYVIDTGNIEASATGTIGLEAAYVNGPFSAQTEFLDSMVRQNNGSALNFYGFYANVSWYLTGESRPYDREQGAFKRLIPRRNFDFGRGGAWGAFEAAARVSHTDLISGDIRGGRLSLVMGELNWYLHSHVRWMFNAGVGHVSGGAYEGDIALFQTRIGVDF